MVTPVGVATVERSAHFTGTPQGELGELAVIEAVEGWGRLLLLAAAEDWAREQGLPFLALGMGNTVHSPESNLPAHYYTN